MSTSSACVQRIVLLAVQPARERGVVAQPMGLGLSTLRAAVPTALMIAITQPQVPSPVPPGFALFVIALAGLPPGLARA